MHKHLHVLQTILVLATLVWGGYWVAGEVLAQAAGGSSVVTESDQDIADQYPGLPPAVARAVQSVVATQQVLNSSNGQGMVASGVIINDEQILTAGHNVEGGGDVACSQVSVVAPGLLTSAAASSDRVNFASVRYGKNADVAVLTVDSSENFRTLPDISLANRQPESGDTVYFINFQPTADGKVRSPAAQNSEDPNQDYSEPVIFPGIVLGKTEHGLAIATGYGKSYGKGVPDNMVRKGASGGAIVNTKGELVGLSVSSSSLQASRPAGSIAKEFRLQLPDHRYQIAYMQAVGGATVNSLQRSVQSCR
jgi:hypothetical protein